MSNHHFVSKGWGWEEWIVNKAAYCGKKLFFKKHKCCSLHHHKLKDETFYVCEGRVKMLWSDDFSMHNEHITSMEQVIDRLNVTILEAGDSFHVPVGRIHRVVALTDSTVFEFSTEHFDDDSYRILKGD